MSQPLKNVPGMNDVLPTHVAAWQRLEDIARRVLTRYGFAEIRMPLLEDTALFTRGIGNDTQVVQKEMYTFIDRGGDSVTLRPEGTAGVVRSFVQHTLGRENPLLKVWYSGPMFRYERPQKGRLRQFHQIGAETFGSAQPLADAELIIMLDRLLGELGIKDYRLELNSLGSAAERGPYLKKLVAALMAVREKLCDPCHQRLAKNPLRVFDCKNEACCAVLANAPTMLQTLTPAGRAHFDAVCAELKRAGVAFTINPRIVRGLDYYEHTAFEFLSNKLGSQSAFAGGGRYDRLVEELGGPPTPAVGFALGCERVVLLLEESGKTAPEARRNGIFLVGLGAADLQRARELVQTLRDAGLTADASLESKSLKAQMKQADRLGLRFAGIIGEEELKSGAVMLKDLGDGSQTAVPMDQLKERLIRLGC
jgi:histidyl-tRNA synthetase